ncbi:hypothetical protein TrRE_jg2266, partial [Triparma retinervis]
MKYLLALFPFIPFATSDPVPLAVASSEDYHPMPNGWSYHSSCITPLDILPDELLPCLYPPKRTLRSPTASASPSASASYYSDWSVYAQSVSSSGITYMSSTWAVPSKPANHGPASQSSVYIFNGLEDGG